MGSKIPVRSAPRCLHRHCKRRDLSKSDGGNDGLRVQKDSLVCGSTGAPFRTVSDSARGKNTLRICHGCSAGSHYLYWWLYVPVTKHSGGGDFEVVPQLPNPTIIVGIVASPSCSVRHTVKHSTPSIRAGLAFLHYAWFGSSSTGISAKHFSIGAKRD